MKPTKLEILQMGSSANKRVLEILKKVKERESKQSNS